MAYSEDAVDIESIVHGRVGTVLVGKYRLDRVIGIGGVAAVYAATHRNQAEFAVKVLHPDFSSRDDIRSRFLREGYIANSVKHAGAVRVVDDDVAEDGGAFLVMELLDGTSVEDLWFRSDRRVPLRPALAIAHQLLDVLSAAHAKTIIHRDIKPANLFVSVTGDVKVLDFGIARLRDITVNSLHATTQSGTMLGTPAFMSPEQARGQSKSVGERTDLWAVGATLFSLVSGSLVHEAETASQLLLRAATSPARPLKSVAPEVPDSIAALVDKALAFEQADRWQSAAAMRDALREAYVRAYHEPPSRQVLAVYHAETEGQPLSTSALEESGDRSSGGFNESLVKTRIEGRRGPVLATTMPLAQKSPVAAVLAEPAPATASQPTVRESGTVEPGPKSPSTPPPAKRSALPLILGVVMAVALAAALLWTTLTKRETTSVPSSAAPLRAAPTAEALPSAAASEVPASPAPDLSDAP